MHLPNRPTNGGAPPQKSESGTLRSHIAALREKVAGTLEASAGLQLEALPIFNADIRNLRVAAP